MKRGMSVIVVEGADLSAAEWVNSVGLFMSGIFLSINLCLFFLIE